MTPLIRISKPQRIPIEDVPRFLDREHTATPMMIYICRQALSPSFTHSREALIKVQATQAPHKAAAFEYNLMRINEALPLLGWQVTLMNGIYCLHQLNDIQFGKVVERHRRRHG